VASADAGQLLSAFYAARHPHSSAAVWQQRLTAGEICRNGQQLRADVALAAGDALIWHRPPWQEAAVPVLPGPLFDDGDLLVFDKPSGLPVLPAGGFLEHTLLAQLQSRWPDARPVHRLGRFTSGLLICARRSATRAWLSAQLRESTAQHRLQKSSTSVTTLLSPCRKTYRALLQPPAPASPLLALAPGAPLSLTTPIGRSAHGRLGTIWAAAPAGDPHALPASSALRLLERGERAWLVEVTIATGRPHQIRIHTAAAGAPLLGDPLYGPGGGAQAGVLPGDGGYHLHAHRLRLVCADGGLLDLEAPLPEALRGGADG
jgi:23S rRNA pseudouridine1911/1915/1917 synthase